MKRVIYYFSGTGNSLKVAKDVAEEINNVEIIKICKDNMDIDSTLFNKIGFVFPVYASGMPLLVKEFINNVKISNKAYVFTVVTFGRAVDASISQLEELLNNKGIKLSAAYKVKMPGSYQIMYPPFPEKAQIKRFENERQAAAEIARSINNNEAVKFTGVGPKVMSIIGNMVQGIYFNPYEKDNNFWVDGNCTGCGICSKLCPANNIKINNGKPEWKHKCEQCLSCMQWCPQKSIQYKQRTINRGRYHHPDIIVKELFNK